MILEGMQSEDIRFTQIFDGILTEAEDLEQSEEDLNDKIQENEK